MGRGAQGRLSGEASFDLGAHWLKEANELLLDTGLLNRTSHPVCGHAGWSRKGAASSVNNRFDCHHRGVPDGWPSNRTMPLRTRCSVQREPLDKLRPEVAAQGKHALRLGCAQPPSRAIGPKVNCLDLGLKVEKCGGLCEPCELLAHAPARQLAQPFPDRAKLAVELQRPQLVERLCEHESLQSVCEGADEHEEEGVACVLDEHGREGLSERLELQQQPRHERVAL
eukprot:CAMPEP_0115840270 /NCGR_PEP_ID=MMETSP0287-20121206/6683_1 /TAXON_ID=412157 /ORGANISM="Chrysochromulina rotalis, Strain UIO044" /LENGTH=225 /DNA_ID=CAMNT_0003293873 /DNA_START=907 /DNA_END=1581 /DNA_ORIENTATION=-